MALIAEGRTNLPIQSSTNSVTKPDKSPSVYSNDRLLDSPEFHLPDGLVFNERMRMDGVDLLNALPTASVPVTFFDPQYRGILDKMSYGNEGESRSKARTELPQMSEETIMSFIALINAALIPSGHLFLWIDKYHLCTGFTGWLDQTELEVVDMLTWHKGRIGMGYRTRRTSEHLIVLQRAPKRAKGVWMAHDIPDVWTEKVSRNGHTHAKPVELQARLIEAVSNPGDVVLDPAAGSFSVLQACKSVGRRFLGCDING